MRKGIVYLYDVKAGIISEDSDGIFRFEYDKEYALRKDALPVSSTMPITDSIYESDRLFPFFDGLIPEADRGLRQVDDGLGCVRRGAGRSREGASDAWWQGDAFGRLGRGDDRGHRTRKVKKSVIVRSSPHIPLRMEERRAETNGHDDPLGSPRII